MADASAGGVLPCQAIRALIDGGAVGAPLPVDADQIQPASLDLRLGHRALRMRASFLPGVGRSVESRAELAMHEMSLEGGAVLERGCVYLVPLLEGLALPADVHAAANAKSSTGRVDLLTRLITDGGTEFDRIPAGYRGPLWAEICPRSFSVLVRPGMRLNQVRFRRGAARLDDVELRALHDAEPLGQGEARVGDGLAFSVDLEVPGDGLVGWRAKPHAGVVDPGRGRTARRAGLLGGARARGAGG